MLGFWASSPTLHLLVVSPGIPLLQERGAKHRGILPFGTPFIHAGFGRLCSSITSPSTRLTKNSDGRPREVERMSQ